MDHLTPPYGGRLVNLEATAERAAELRALAADLPAWTLTDRQSCDLELLAQGAFSPLEGFLPSADWKSVCAGMRLADGTVWPLPVTLDVSRAVAERAGKAGALALRDAEGAPLAVLQVADVWEPDRRAEADAVFATLDRGHPGVRYLLERTHPWYVGGRVEVIEAPHHYDFAELRLPPARLREELAAAGWRRVVAFQTRNPMHRAHVELALRAAAEADANLLIHPVVGPTKPGDIDHYTRVRCYRAILPHFPPHTVKLALLPFAMRMGGPREALLHAIIRRNHGCTHLVVGRDHAGPGRDANGEPFYDPYAAQELVQRFAAEVGVAVVPFRELAYVEELDRYVPHDEVPEGRRALSVSGTELRERLFDGRDLPPWFTFPEVVDELRRSHPPRCRQGFTVLFTGLSGAGKSTVAKVLLARFLEVGDRPVTLLDGDIVRRNLSSELGFSKEHRDINIRRIGFVASEITKNGGIAICAPIAPYDAIRKEVRAQIEPLGGFTLVHVSTPLEVCEQRDRKGLYAKARAGLIPEFTGVSDPYEAPDDAEVVIDTTSLTPEECAQEVLLHLQRAGYIGA